jgi:DNA-binding NarL/FixJ family response regulator
MTSSALPSSATPLIRTVVIGDVDDLRWVLRLALERHGAFDVVGEATTGESGLGAALLAEADLVLIDLDMDGRGALDAVRRLRAWSPETAVVGVTHAVDRVRVSVAIEQGASGVLRKGTRLSVLAERARAFAEENRVAAPRAS